MPSINDYKLKELIGKGSFGKVYKAQHKRTKEYVAIKLEERVFIDDQEQESKLIQESIFLKKINCKYVPVVEWIGRSKFWNILIMQYLGPSLEELFQFCNKKFSLKTICMIAEQILSGIEKIHKKGIVHRDIKPDNFLIGYGKLHNRLYIIDFGLSKKFINTETFQHEDFNQCRQFTGSFRYSSIKNHKGIEQSRRDDLESIGYMFIFFLKGKLPWQGLSGTTKKEKLRNVYEKKKNTSIDELCDGIPKEFKLYIKYCRRLRYSEKPDYHYLKGLIHSLIKKKRYKIDYKFDWDKNFRNFKHRKISS